MPKGPKSVGQLCGELGMDTIAETNFRKESQNFLKLKIEHVQNASDEAIEAVALDYLNSGAGAKHFSWDAALNYQWEASEHRLTIVTFVGDIMKQQRWYLIDRLHKRVGGALNCTGCLLHKRKSISGGGDIAGSEASHAGSIHNVINQDSDREGSQGRKRSRASDYYEPLTGAKRRKSGASEDSDGTVGLSKRESESQATASSHNGPTKPQTSGFTPVNPSVAPETQRLRSWKPATAVSALPPPITQHDCSNILRFRGKTWHFDGIAHKARVLEQIIVQEEKDVEAYPILAFSKDAKKTAFGHGEDSEGGDNALKDYFRFYTHFMNERFPASEKILLENGVKPSA